MREDTPVRAYRKRKKAEQASDTRRVREQRKRRRQPSPWIALERMYPGIAAAWDIGFANSGIEIVRIAQCEIMPVISSKPGDGKPVAVALCSDGRFRRYDGVTQTWIRSSWEIRLDAPTRISVHLQTLTHVESLNVPAALAPLFLVVEIIIGGRPQASRQVPVVGAWIANNGREIAASAGAEVSIDVLYIGTEPLGHLFNAALVGRAANGSRVAIPISSNGAIRKRDRITELYGAWGNSDDPLTKNIRDYSERLPYEIGSIGPFVKRKNGSLT